MTKIIFLDFDGVIRIPSLGFCLSRIRTLSGVCRKLNAKIVISSVWRKRNTRGSISKLITPFLSPFLHEDWTTEQLDTRWEEVQSWLQNHDPVEYAILEDYKKHFVGCPADMQERIVWCDTKTGLDNARLHALTKLFA